MAGAGIPKWLQYVNKFPLGMIINGEFWVCVFAILSGYLLNKKDIRNGADLIKICINRYFRFVIPFFFANFFVYLLYNFVGFSAQKCGMIVLLISVYLYGKVFGRISNAFLRRLTFR